jgi:hypothetical protein
MSADDLFKRPNSHLILAAAAPAVGGLKGIIAGLFTNFIIVYLKIN